MEHTCVFDNEDPIHHRFATINDLPLEIILSIVHDLILQYTPPSELWESRPGPESSRIAEYRKERSRYANLALTSQSFRSAIEYTLYTTLVIFNDTDVENLSEALQRRGARVRTLIYDATLRDLPYEGDVSPTRYLALDHCLAAMTNLQTLKVFGSHIMFMDPHLRASWQTVIPDFPQFALPSCSMPPIRTLVWKCPCRATYYDKQLIHALSLLSASLEELHIHEWRTTSSLVNSVAIPMPRLKYLHIIGGDVPLDGISRLIEQTLAIHDGEKASGLKGLVLWDRGTEGREREVRTLLSNHSTRTTFDRSIYLNYTTLPTLSELTNAKLASNNSNTEQGRHLGEPVSLPAWLSGLE